MFNENSGQIVIDVLTKQTKEILSKISSIDIDSMEEVLVDGVDIPLKDYTVMMGVGGELNFMILFSIDTLLVDPIAEYYVGNKKIEENEKEVIYHSIASETINTIVGRSLSSFPNEGGAIDITTPINISTASQITRHKDSKIKIVKIKTTYGDLIIGFIR